MLGVVGGSTAFDRGFLFHLVLNKPFKKSIMVKLVFTGTEKSKTDTVELEVFANMKNELFIEVRNENYFSYICLDRDTAIKFSKVIKSEISKITE